MAALTCPDCHCWQQGHGDTKLTEDEAMIIGGALEMTNKTVQCCLTPLKDVFMLEASTLLDMDELQRIQAEGRSRVPVYEERRDNIVGMILVKDLLLMDHRKKVRAKEVVPRIPRAHAHPHPLPHLPQLLSTPPSTDNAMAISPTHLCLPPLSPPQRHHYISLSPSLSPIFLLAMLATTSVTMSPTFFTRPPLHDVHHCHRTVIYGTLYFWQGPGRGQGALTWTRGKPPSTYMCSGGG